MDVDIYFDIMAQWGTMSGGFVSYSVELFNFLNMETVFTVFDIDGLTDGIMQTVQLMPGVTYDLSISMWMELINMGTVENGGFHGDAF